MFYNFLLNCFTVLYCGELLTKNFIIQLKLFEEKFSLTSLLVIVPIAPKTNRIPTGTRTLRLDPIAVLYDIVNVVSNPNTKTL